MVKRLPITPASPLPKALVSALFERRRRLATSARGRVLDLGGWRDHLDDYQIGGTVASVTALCHTDATLSDEAPADETDAGLSATDPKGLVWLDCGLDQLGDAGLKRFDTIVSLARTPFVVNRERFLQTITELLADDGELLLLEPVVAAKHKRRTSVASARRPVGDSGRAVSARRAISTRFGRSVKGLNLGWDLPAAIRDLGMTITDLDRFEVRTLPPPLRPFMEARVRWPRSSFESRPPEVSSP